MHQDSNIDPDIGVVPISVVKPSYGWPPPPPLFARVTYSPLMHQPKVTRPAHSRPRSRPIKSPIYSQPAPTIFDLQRTAYWTSDTGRRPYRTSSSPFNLKLDGVHSNYEPVLSRLLVAT